MELRKRKNIRLNGYDYSQTGRYFITICSKNRVNLFGDIICGDMRISEYGEIVQNELVNIPSYYKNIGVDVFVVMPNHVHMIVAIHPTEHDMIETEYDPAERMNPFPTKAADIPNIIGKYKAGVTRIVGNALMRSDTRAEIWQSRYHDHIIRNDKAYRKIYEYIENNPMKWEIDCHNPISPKYKDWSENKIND